MLALATALHNYLKCLKVSLESYKHSNDAKTIDRRQGAICQRDHGPVSSFDCVCDIISVIEM